MDKAGEQWAVIGEDAAFSGRLTGRNVIVNGRVEGELELSGRLRLGPLSVVKATVRAAAVELDGEFEGEIQTVSLAFGGTARARGVFRADRLSIREGALVNGALNPSAQDAPAQQATTVAPEEPEAAGTSENAGSAVPGEMSPPAPSVQVAQPAA